MIMFQNIRFLGYRIFIPLILSTLIFFSCHRQYKNEASLRFLITNVDKLQVINYYSLDTTETILTDHQTINIITDLIDGKVNDNLNSCTPTGKINFYKAGHLVFQAFFSVGNVNGSQCEQINYIFKSQHYNSCLTYRAGMMLAHAFDTMDYSIDNCNLKINNGVINFLFPIKKVIRMGDALVVLIKPPLKTIYNENVFGVSLKKAKIIWQIKKQLTQEASCKYTEIKAYDKTVGLNNWCDFGLSVDPSTGEILGKGYHK